MNPILSAIVVTATMVSLVSLSAASDAVDALSNLIASMHSVSADFEQEIIDNDGTVLERSSGHMIATRGNRFRWDIDSPWPQQLISDGNTLWQYDIELEQVVERALEPSVQQTPGLLFSGDGAAIIAAYDVVELETEPDRRRFELRPHDDNGLFDVLEIEFVGEIPKVMLLTDRFGQQTRLRFEHVSRNLDFGDELFQLELPEGVDVSSDRQE